MRGSLARSALVVSALALAWPAQAQTTLQLVEVITSPQRTEVLRGMVNQFEVAHPGVTVEITSLPWGQAFEKLATMVQGGQIPDVVEMPDRWLSLYANNDQLVDLSAYMADWGEADELNERTVEFGSYVNNTPYMIPYGFYLRALFYNKKLFKQAGLDGPPETMDDFMAAAKAYMPTRLPMKSGVSLQRTTPLPSTASPSRVIAATTAGSVSGPVAPKWI